MTENNSNQLGLFKTINQSSSLFSKRDKILAFASIGIYGFLSLLDVIGVLAIGLLGSLVVTGVSGAQTGNRVVWVLQTIGIEERNLSVQISVIGILSAVILLGKSISSWYLSKKMIFFLSLRAAKISRNLVTLLFSQNLAKIRSRSIQETIFSVTTGVQSLATNILGASILLISDVILIFVFLFTLLVVDFSVAFMTMGMFSIAGFTLYYLTQKKALELGRKNTKYDIESRNKISEVVFAYKEIFVKSRLDFFAKEVGDTRENLAEVSAELNALSLANKYVIELTLVVGGLVIGAIQFASQPPSRAVGVISVFLVISARVAPAVLRIQGGLISLKAGLGLAEPTLELIDELTIGPKSSWEVRNVSTVVEFKNNQYHDFIAKVEFKDLCFEFADENSPLIKDFNFDVNPGEFIGIAGATGAGKTTLADILLGITKPTSGSVFISGMEPEVALKYWPGAVAYVSQETFLTNGTIKENVCLGFNADEISDEAVLDLMYEVDLKALTLLPKGIHSRIGEKGFILSGGEKQRIGIARALLTGPQLIVLDESTSALDGNTERVLTENLLKMRGKSTFFVIAHRLSTLADADKILYVEKGKQITVATFQELKQLIPDFQRQANLTGL